MGGSTQGPSQTTQQAQTQNTVTNPWDPAQPLLKQILASLGGQSTSMTPEQQAAIGKLQQQAGTVPSFAPQAVGTIGNLFGASTAPSQGILGSAYQDLQGRLSGIADPANLNPMSTPGFSDALKAQMENITNQLEGQWGAAGRAFSPSEAQSVSRGLAQGTAPTIAGQYNANVGNLQSAAGTLFGGGTGTALNMAQLSQLPLADQLQALSATGQIPGILTQPATTQLGAANTAFGLPFQNIAGLEGLVTPIAGLGSSGYSSGTGTSTTSSTQPLLNTIMGGIGLGLGTYGALASDERVKKDIRPVGILFKNKLPVYTYRYKDDPDNVTRIGLLAQDVELVKPEAVVENEEGVKHVKYDVATG